MLSALVSLLTNMVVNINQNITGLKYFICLITEAFSKMSTNYIYR